MPTTSLRSLAHHLGVPERTLRRATADGLVHAERVSPRRFRVTLKEEAYLRRHWALLAGLRQALRTEPNVRLGVLFGSYATGVESEQSDIDVLVALDDPAAARLADLAARLRRQVEQDVQIVRLTEAEANPHLMTDVLRNGRVLVDRNGLWRELKATEDAWQRHAAAAEPEPDWSPPELELP